MTNLDITIWFPPLDDILADSLKRPMNFVCFGYHPVKSLMNLKDPRVVDEVSKLFCWSGVKFGNGL
jgi:hypothetical protein